MTDRSSQTIWAYSHFPESLSIKINRNEFLFVRDYDIEEFGTKVGYVLEENAIKVGYVLERIYLWSI